MANSKVPIGVKITDMSTKWGLVSVYDAQGILLRSYAITAKEAIAVSDGINIAPPGCTDEEWFSGRVMLDHRPCNPGQGVINPDGTLIINTGVVDNGNKKQISLMALQPTEYEHKDGVLSVDAGLVTQVDKPFTEVAPEKAKVS